MMNQITIRDKEYMYVMEPFNPLEDCTFNWRIFLPTGIYFGAVQYNHMTHESRFWYADHLHTCNTVKDAVLPLAALYDFLGEGR